MTTSLINSNDKLNNKNNILNKTNNNKDNNKNKNNNKNTNNKNNNSDNNVATTVMNATNEEQQQLEATNRATIAILGAPAVGKSSIINQFLFYDVNHPHLPNHQQSRFCFFGYYLYQLV